MGCRLNKSMCRLEKTEFGEEFKSSGKRNQFSLGREETRSILATCCCVTNHPQSVLAVKTMNIYHLRVAPVRM